MRILRSPPERSLIARKSVEHVEAVDERVVAVRQDLAPALAVGLLADVTSIRRKFGAFQFVRMIQRPSRCSAS